MSLKKRVMLGSQFFFTICSLCNHMSGEVVDPLLTTCQVVTEVFLAFLWRNLSLWS